MLADVGMLPNAMLSNGLAASGANKLGTITIRKVHHNLLADVPFIVFERTCPRLDMVGAMEVVGDVEQLEDLIKLHDSARI